MSRVTLSIGSNLGDRASHLRKALGHLLSLHEGSPETFCVSRVYETEPMQCPEGSDAFLNAVVELTTTLAPPAFLSRTRAIEAGLGRPPVREVNAPRVIDIDLLFFNDQTWDSPELQLPHPRWQERGFVLMPLHDIRPDLVDREQVAAWLAPDSDVRLWAASLGEF